MTGKQIMNAVASVLLLALLSACGDDQGVPYTGTLGSAAAHVTVDNGVRGETAHIGLVSWRDIPFQTVKHQTFDYSCGSAAVATLMTFVYGSPVTEKEVFQWMFAKGDQNKIRREGFSMLDMSDYLNAHGLRAKGYRITEKAIAEYRVPFIALINRRGYNHFVVVKSMGDGRILVGDPNTGNTVYDLPEFMKMWGGIALIVTNDAREARAVYGDPKEWRFARAKAPLRSGNDTGTETATLDPMAWQIAPFNPSILPATMIGTASSGGGGVP